MRLDTTPGLISALLDDDEVGVLLRCSARHVQRMARSGRMPPGTKLGALTRWSRAAIEDWIAKGCPHTSRKAVRDVR